jgi:hypothetical protein
MNPKGRPAGKGETKCRRFEIRLTEEECQMLQFASKKLGINMSAVLIKGLKMVYNLAKIAV